MEMSEKEEFLTYVLLPGGLGGLKYPSAPARGPVQHSAARSEKRRSVTPAEVLIGSL
ncbi:hypothetical protein LSTR_LSTR004220 [Laodelphax striatellus]|uniref:Uncharacterized protein n=1 Tax=Laodelphax striatellus TaxID=195883 RepID=A0A482X9S1_LAOST|nr:hypothetical protein LSTR_LSTR004220 [Laodelphax striatellus]